MRCPNIRNKGDARLFLVFPKSSLRNEHEGFFKCEDYGVAVVVPYFPDERTFRCVSLETDVGQKVRRAMRKAL